ncbi:MAG TPA: right-handed parallel beta-helix repeat-containing protein [Rhizobiaceae bacterium]|nr:right-handed parallel beta-helix repeat-containing protein [Rhizobiaceae bacterium]
MTIFTRLARDIFSAVNANGTARQIVPAEAQTWGTEIERVIDAAVNTGGLIYDSKADINADLAHPANTMAWVLGDATAANNGVYLKSGASGAGSWTRVGDLPYSFIRATNAGAGTANAIQATTAVPIPAADGAALIALPIVADNLSGLGDTVSFNGGPALTLVSASGQGLRGGDLRAGMVVVGYKIGTDFRLLNDFNLQFVGATNDGSGTANAIVATTDAPFAAGDAGALITVPIAADNTASPVTISFNGGTALTIKTLSGGDIAPGGLTAGMIVAGYVSGSTFRLITDQASAAILEQAEAAADRAEAALGFLIEAAAGHGAIGDGASDDTTHLQAALDTGRRVWLTPGKTYKVTSRLTIPSGGGLISDGTAKIYAPAASFNNTDLNDNYGDTAVVIDLSGETSGAFTANENVCCIGVEIYSDVQGGRLLNAIVARNVIDLDIRDNHIRDFPVGCGIKVASVRGNSRIEGNRIHDFTDDTDWGVGVNPQITGIEVDDDRVNSIYSVALSIKGNRIAGLTVGSTFLAAHGYQTDGINISAPSGSFFHVIEGNRIANIGEGIDCWGWYCSIKGNTIQTPYYAGIKLVHTASYNAVQGNTILNAGAWGITISGSASVAGDLDGNVFTGNVIAGIDPNNLFAGVMGTGCINTDDGALSKPTNNLFADNYLDPGTYGQYTIRRASTGTGNTYRNNKERRSGALGWDGGGETSSLVPADRTVVMAYMASDATIVGASGAAKIPLDTALHDARGEFDAVNNRIVLNHKGKYRVTAKYRVGTITSGSAPLIQVRRNGTTMLDSSDTRSAAGEFHLEVSGMVEITAAAQYLEVWQNLGDATTRTITGGSRMTFLMVEQIA